ncbi:immunoglobulin superfamily member 5 [Alosa sapidissima]|uniref:immunoglobulin superfamily member 5 n=1 Tax=Alosa sapidissima TaxID=34773 RepID=UPI001C09FF51|nr:immunoglobulin superfamily member 5 [Alosa sapidissima]XP_041919306.1 immunoglobulin superfamily member 5 [Alosa sapidissima]
MLCVALLLVQLAFATQGQDASSSSSSFSSSSSLRQSELVLEPRSLAVLTGQSARFNCSTTEPWTIMIWRLDDASVMVVSAGNGATNTTLYKAVNCSTAQTSCWELVMERVIRSNSAQPHRVVCETLGGLLMAAELHIQESGSVVVTGGNVSVPSGQTVEFQCVALGWFPEPSVEWFLDGQPLGRDSFNTSSELDRTRALYNATSTLVLEARRRGSVECRVSVSAMAAPLSASTYLSVVQGKDDTAVIAAVSYVAAMLLVILITICIMLYLWRRGLRKESSIPETERIDQHRSQQSSVAEETEGRVNAGYSSECSSSFVDTESSVSMHSRRTTASTEEAYTTEEMPDVVPSPYNTIYFISLGDKSIKTPRSVTTV